MKIFFDLLPVVLFFVAYKMGNPFADAHAEAGSHDNLYFATLVIMIAMTIQVIGVYAVKRTVEKMYLFTWIAVVVLGSMTLILQNPNFIKWKPTIVNWILGGVFLGSQLSLFDKLFGEKNLVQHMLGAHFDMPKSAWNKTNLAWVAFFLISGLLNIIVAYTCAENTWVNFKLFGLTGLSFVFMFGLVFCLKDFIKPLEDDEKEEKTADATTETDTADSQS
jgi:intracellular septation protein